MRLSTRSVLVGQYTVGSEIEGETIYIYTFIPQRLQALPYREHHLEIEET